MKNSRNKLLVIIPARSGSKRLPGKNIKNFLGKPLIAYSIQQALSLPYADRVIVDTDSQEIALIARRYGAEIPFLRPLELSQDDSMVLDSIFNVLARLKKDQRYLPTHLLILQTTSPLRSREDMDKCWNCMKKNDFTSVVTVCASQPRLFNLNRDNILIPANKSIVKSSNAQDWKEGFVLSGGVFLLEIKSLYKEKTVLMKSTAGVVCPKWRSLDIDTPEEWVMSELLYKNSDHIINSLIEL